MGINFNNGSVIKGEDRYLNKKSEAYERKDILVNQSANHKERAKTCAVIASLGCLITFSALALGYVNGGSAVFYNLVGASLIPCAMAVFYVKRHLNCEKNIENLSIQLKMLEFTEISETLKADDDEMWKSLRNFVPTTDTNEIRDVVNISDTEEARDPEEIWDTEEMGSELRESGYVQLIDIETNIKLIITKLFININII